MAISSTQIQHISRNIRQRLFKVPVGIVGGYHGGNLGDMALGEAVKMQLKAQNITSGLETIYNLKKWPVTPYAILGGGAIGYINSLRQVIDRYQGDYSRIGILGVDFNEKMYPEDCLELIRKAAFVSARSQNQAKHLEVITGRAGIQSHPDIAFSLAKEFCKKQRAKGEAGIKGQKILMVNVVPLYANIRNRNIIPTESYKSERPELYEGFEQMHASYKKIVRTNIEKALAEGYTVETIPFTPADSDYAKLILEELPVTHTVYQPNPDTMIKKMAKADRILATRFHATIFALKLGVKLTPVAYAKKNEFMLQALGLNRNSFLSSEDLALGKDEFLPPVQVEAKKIEQWEQESEDAIRLCIQSLQIKK